MHGILAKDFSGTFVGRTQTLYSFLYSNAGNLVENCDRSGGSFTSHTKEMTRKCANHQRKTTNYNSGGRWLVRPPFRNLHANLGKELEHAATLVNLVLCCSSSRKSSGNL